MIFSPDGRPGCSSSRYRTQPGKNRLHFDLRPTDGTREARSTADRPRRHRSIPTTDDPTAAAGSPWRTRRATSSACSAVIRRCTRQRTPTSSPEQLRADPGPSPTLGGDRHRRVLLRRRAGRRRRPRLGRRAPPDPRSGDRLPVATGRGRPASTRTRRGVAGRGLPAGRRPQPDHDRGPGLRRALLGGPDAAPAPAALRAPAGPDGRTPSPSPLRPDRRRIRVSAGAASTSTSRGTSCPSPTLPVRRPDRRCTNTTSSTCTSPTTRAGGSPRRAPAAAGGGELADRDPAAPAGLRRRHPARRVLHPRPAAVPGPLRRRPWGHGDAGAGVPRPRPGAAGRLPGTRQPPRDRHTRPPPRFGVFPEVLNLSDADRRGRLRRSTRSCSRSSRQPVRARRRATSAPGRSGSPAPLREPSRSSAGCPGRSTCSGGSPSSCATGSPPGTGGWSAGTRSTTRARSRVRWRWPGGTPRTGSPPRRPGMDVVMAPMTHTYLDYYPSDGDDEAYAIGGLTTTETGVRRSTRWTACRPSCTTGCSAPSASSGGSTCRRPHAPTT